MNLVRDGDRAGAVLTPYPGMSDADRFLRGATLDLDDLGRRPDALAGRLRTMRDRFRIDTVGVYDLAEWERPGTTAAKDALFRALTAANMRLVVRLEAYDPESFAFADADVDRLLTRYAGLLSYVGVEGRRDRIAYLAVNMPLDDPRVQDRVGGVNSSISARRQLAYATAAVARLRAFFARAGVADLAVYLGVFYGWDGSYRPPSYAPAGADGYFLTSYGYPGETVADHRASDAALIDEPRRRATMLRFLEQYGAAPVIVEYGVHTAERHGGRRPHQLAGLVRDRAAKRRALAATTRFYCTDFPHVRGTMYFGFNVYKTEGSPPAVLDFGLDR